VRLRYFCRLDQPRSHRDHVARQQDDLPTGVVQNKPPFCRDAFDDRLVLHVCAFLYEDTPPLPGQPGTENRQEFIGRKGLKERGINRFQPVYKGAPKPERAKCAIRRAKLSCDNFVARAQFFCLGSGSQIHTNASQNAAEALLHQNSRHFAVIAQKIIRPFHLNRLAKAAQRLGKEISQHQRPQIVPAAVLQGTDKGGEDIAPLRDPGPAQLPAPGVLGGGEHAAPGTKRSTLHQTPRHIHRGGAGTAKDQRRGVIAGRGFGRAPHRAEFRRSVLQTPRGEGSHVRSPQRVRARKFLGRKGLGQIRQTVRSYHYI